MKLKETKIKKIISNIFHRCTCVQEVYPDNKGSLRLVECVECGKYHVLKINDKDMKKIKIKSFNNISIYIKNRK